MRMKIASGSRWLEPTWTAAANACVLSTWRLTAGGETRRSATSIPAAFRPEIIARLIIRQPGAESRLATTRASLQRGAERGRSLAAVSGVRSTLTRPPTPSFPNKRDEARVSQIRFS